MPVSKLQASTFMWRAQGRVHHELGKLQLRMPKQT